MNQNDNLKKFLSLLVFHVGGKSNIMRMTNCMTRLRIGLKDIDLVNPQDLDVTESPYRLILKENQLQVLLGPGLAPRSTEMLKNLLTKETIVAN